ncbi:hypothetical protein GBAR_LOCUS13002 [Geodia barretti]|nr:hypothetical protein GBAR_LOCUS13002 [Geodia barretti]
MAMLHTGKLPHRSVLNNSAAIAYRLLRTSSSAQVHVFLYPSLTPSNMRAALDTLPADKWVRFGGGLRVSKSKLDQIRSQFTSDEERRDEVSKISSLSALNWWEWLTSGRRWDWLSDWTLIFSTELKQRKMTSKTICQTR